MVEKWVTVKEASEIVGRSPHTVYNWIVRTRKGEAKPPLIIRRSDRENGKGWLILVKSLLKVEEGSPRAARPRARLPEDDLVDHNPLPKPIGFDGTRSCFRGGDTMKRVHADRRKWVRRWVVEGKSLFKVLAVFSPELHEEVEWHYRQALAEEREEKREEEE